MVAILKADTDGTAAYQLLVLKDLITTMTVITVSCCPLLWMHTPACIC